MKRINADGSGTALAGDKEKSANFSISFAEPPIVSKNKPLGERLLEKLETVSVPKSLVLATTTPISNGMKAEQPPKPIMHPLISPLFESNAKILLMSMKT